jgi:NADH-quinone oxidoreductase subunit L
VGGWIAIPGVDNVPHEFLHQAHAAPTREALEAAEFMTAEQWLLALTVGLGAAVLGLGISYLVWGNGAMASWRTRFPALERVFQSAFGFDALYDRVFARPAQALATALRRTDEAVTLPMLEEVELSAVQASDGLSRAQSGLVRGYAFATVLAFVAIVVAVVWIGA